MKAAAAPTDQRFFAVAAPGLEAITAAELDRLGIAREAPEPGGVGFGGGFDAMARTNLWLRTSSRVLLRMGEFHARALGELERRAAGIEWGRYLSASQPVQLRVTSRKSRLYHQKAIAERISNAIARVTGAPVSAASGAEDEAHDTGQLVIVRMLRDECLISLDTSGELLHRRGYRQAVAKAPLRETLAAALLVASGWDPSFPLLDPFSGSGTIPIEAALLARRIAPGLARSFGFERWPGHDAAAVERHREAARESTLPGTSVAIMGSDRDSGAVEAARGNAGRAGVLADVSFEKAAVSAVAAPPGKGWVVSNPPYGVRVGEQRKLRDLYARLGQVLRGQFPGWTVALLLSRGHARAELGLDLDPVATTRNGGIEVDIAVGRVPE